MDQPTTSACTRTPGAALFSILVIHWPGAGDAERYVSENKMTYQIIFALIITISLIASAFSIFESLSTKFFKESLFGIGFTVFRNNIEIKEEGREKFKLGHTYDIDGGEYKFINQNKCLFHAKMSLFDSISEFSLLPIKGTVRWRQGKANIVAKVPLGQTIFIVCLLSALAVGTGLIPSDAKNRIVPILLMVIFLLGGCWVFKYSIYSLKKRTQRISEIIINHISIGSSGRDEALRR